MRIELKTAESGQSDQEGGDVLRLKTILGQRTLSQRSTTYTTNLCPRLSGHIVSQPRLQAKDGYEEYWGETPLKTIQAYCGLRMNWRPSWQKDGYKSPELSLYNKC